MWLQSVKVDIAKRVFEKSLAKSYSLNVEILFLEKKAGDNIKDIPIQKSISF